MLKIKLNITLKKCQNKMCNIYTLEIRKLASFAISAVTPTIMDLLVLQALIFPCLHKVKIHNHQMQWMVNLGTNEKLQILETTTAKSSWQGTAINLITKVQ
jgi:hypothetical protein